jgi:Na+-translocating ferredoxin:NAD+ oxidoreductase RnfG subunit
MSENKNNKDNDNNDSIENSENIENIENPENPEHTESSDAVDAAENTETEVVESAEIAEIVEIAENAETVESIEIVEAVEEEKEEKAEKTEEPAGDGVPGVPPEKVGRAPFDFKNSIFGTAVILAIITVVIVFAISLLNSVTKPVIEQRLFEEKIAAIERLFGSGVESLDLEGFEDMFLDFDAPVTGVYLILDDSRLGDDKTAGYCVLVAPKGFTDSIVMLVAVTPNLTVKDTLILSMNETAGYGTRLDGESDFWFREQFWNKSRNIRDVRTAPNPGENSIQIIAGATVSSKAFLRGVNAALDIIYEIDAQLRAEAANEPESENGDIDKIDEEEENPDA